MTGTDVQQRCRLLIGLVVTLLFAALPGVAALADQWRIKDEVFGELKDGRKPGSLDGDDYKKAKNISGIACARKSGFPRRCLIVDDEAQGAQIVILKEDGGEAGSFIPLVDDVYKAADGKTKALDFDGEAVAYADGAFYVAGSHGRPRRGDDDPNEDRAEQDAKAEASKRLFRVTFVDDSIGASGELGKPPTIRETARLNEAIAAHPQISDYSNAALKEQGLTVEGIAVLNGQLYAGLRAPVVKGEAYMLAVPAKALFQDKPLTSRLIGVKLGTDSRNAARGIRDLVPFRGDLLLIAGPAVDPLGDVVADGDYTLFHYALNGTLTRLVDLPSYGIKTKPEAVLPLSDDGKRAEVLLLFDGPEEGAGKVFGFPVPLNP